MILGNIFWSVTTKENTFLKAKHWACRHTNAHVRHFYTARAIAQQAGSALEATAAACHTICAAAVVLVGVQVPALSAAADAAAHFCLSNKKQRLACSKKLQYCTNME